MTDTVLKRILIGLVAAGAVTLAFTIFGVLFFAAAFVVYAKRVALAEQQVAQATASLLTETVASPRSLPVDSAASQLARLLDDTGLKGGQDG